MYIVEKGAHARDQAIEQVKVQWKEFRPDEAAWVMVYPMRAMYPSLFAC